MTNNNIKNCKKRIFNSSILAKIQKKHPNASISLEVIRNYRSGKAVSYEKELIIKNALESIKSDLAKLSIQKKTA